MKTNLPYKTQNLSIVIYHLTGLSVTRKVNHSKKMFTKVLTEILQTKIEFNIEALLYVI